MVNKYQYDFKIDKADISASFSKSDPLSETQF